MFGASSNTTHFKNQSNRNTVNIHNVLCIVQYNEKWEATADYRHAVTYKVELTVLNPVIKGSDMLLFSDGCDPLRPR